VSMMNAVLGGAMGLERVLWGSRLRVDPEAVKSVLVLEYMLPLGCCVHLTPVFEAIKTERPEVVITVATRGLGAALLKHDPCVDHVIETPDALTDTLGAARVLRGELRRRGLRPDCVLTGASDQRTRIALLGLLCGVGWRGGFTLAPQMYQRALKYDAGRSLIANNLRLGGLVGCGEGHREPRVYFSAADVAVAEGLVREANPEGRPLLVLVTQNSGGQRTGWHAERFVEVIRYAREVMGCGVVFVGTAGDSAAVEGLRVGAGVGTSVTGRTSVTELAALLAMSDAVVSLDTGTMHVGRAVGVPMVVIGPSWQRPVEWLPLGVPQVRILRGADREGVPEGYRLDEVEAADVMGALRELMEVYPASAESRAARVARGLSAVDHQTRSV
jgi:ADP-heptose:LPS heptosyltransferase